MYFSPSIRCRKKLYFWFLHPPNDVSGRN